MEDIAAILAIAGVVNLVLIIVLISKLNAIKRESQKTNYFLTRVIQEQGGKLNDTDRQALNS